MTTGSILNEIKVALVDMPQGDLYDAGRRLLETLGYSSDRTLELSGDVNEFIDSFPAPNQDTQTERHLRQQVVSVHILFQITDSEIAELTSSQGQLSVANGFDQGDAKSFVFVSVELRAGSYTRGAYAEFTREVNKRLSQPTVVLFRNFHGMITLAFVHRRLHKRDRRRSVLGSVSLIREIDTTKPHRAHLDILSKLALPERLTWMDKNGKLGNFDGLLAAWLDALDTEELNRNFYKQLFTWFERAVKDAKFPTKQVRTLSPEEHVIRLITRLLFVWFIKEKGLVAPELFSEAQVDSLLHEYDRETGDSYYRAILQNLFFATLNSDIGHRSFSKVSGTTYRVFSRYRYKSEIADPDRLLELFSKTPFINGGLFDCLDSEKGSRNGGYRIDCFTDNVNDPEREDYKLLSVPNRLFFDNNGLISLFDRFQFTVEENTPTEKEVALDPELLGKVFENLLASFNPETSKSARRQTGSYYTPREVVDYMVDESLVASLAQSCSPEDGKARSWRDRLLALLDYDVDYDHDTRIHFDESEKKQLVRAIADLKLIDPAVGSGAFPMGALHKLTLALRRLDPRNTLWENLQKELAGHRAAEAFETEDQDERDAELEEISATFEQYRDSDFGRKLYLIQNSIFGVDIQTIACQISKLRFFISLAIEQEPDPSADNFGIKPLPNLETRFVAANTLIGLDIQSQMLLGQNNPAVDELQRELNTNREHHFHANTRQKKLECVEKDQQLRSKLATALEQSGLPTDDAEKIARWDPFDQNAKANWFDVKYMFGITEGFDLVIGNPPYVVVQDPELRALYKEGVYGRMNLYGLFIQRGLQLLGDFGQLAFINPRTLLTDKYFMNLRKVIRKQSELKGIVLIADRHNTFENVLQECIILHLCKKSNPSSSYSVGVRSISRPVDLTDPHTTSLVTSDRVLLDDKYDNTFYIGSSEFDYKVFEQMNSDSVRLSDLGIRAETGKVQFDKYHEYARSYNSGSECRLVWAENIQRYTKRDSKNRIGKEWLSGEIISQLSPNITGKGIVTQRISANEQPRRIIATLVAPEYFLAENVYSENHTNFISLNEASNSSLLLGTLNSSMIEFFFRRTNSNTQVSAGEINLLPFPLIHDDSSLTEIEMLVSALLSLGGVDCPTSAIAHAIELEHRLDVLIGYLYGFMPDEVERIQKQLPSYESVYSR